VIKNRGQAIETLWSHKGKNKLPIITDLKVSFNERNFYFLKFAIFTKVVIISHKAIREFVIEHPKLLPALERWYDITMKSDWQGFNDIKKDFNSVDSVGDGLFVFNIKGNDCRLIVRIIFKTRTVFIRFIGTHKEYDLVKIKDL
jgi:mRNA interferase HigB